MGYETTPPETVAKKGGRKKPYQQRPLMLNVFRGKRAAGGGRKDQVW